MSTFFTRVALALVVCTLFTATTATAEVHFSGGHSNSKRHVAFYTAMQSGDAVLRWLEDGQTVGNTSGRPVANAIYFCCGAWSLTDEGTFVPRKYITDNATKIKDMVNPLKAKGIEVFFVLGTTYNAIYNSTWRNTSAIQALAQQAVEYNFDGVIMDFEPSPPADQRVALEKAYGEFLTEMAQEFGKVSKKAGFDAADWGILGAWQIYKSTGLQLFTTMATYFWRGNGSRLFHYIDEEISQVTKENNGTIDLGSLGFGVGTMITPDYKPNEHLHYNWTSSSFKTFLSFLSSKNLTRVSFWRKDIDNNFPAVATEPWLFTLASKFLGGAI